jgi:hypothetical protein
VLGGVGVLAKEMVFPVIPLAVWQYARLRPRPWGPLAATALLALLPTLAVRLWIPAHDAASGNVRMLFDYVAGWPMLQLRSVGLLQTCFYMFASFGVLWVLAPLGVDRAPAHGRSILLAWALCTAPFVLLGTPERMLEILAPAVIPMALFALDGLAWPAAALVIAANGLFVIRVACAGVPYALGWGGLGCAAFIAGWCWVRAAVMPWARRRVAVRSLP